MSNELRPNEIECWKMFHQGKSIADIGCARGLATSSVRTYLNSAKRKIAADPSLDPLKKKSSSRKKTGIVDTIKAAVSGKSNTAEEPKSTSKKKSKELWTQDELNSLRRATNASSLKEILKGIKVRGKSLEERVQEYKLIRCAVCPHGPYDTSRCSSRCADPILADKYLY